MLIKQNECDVPRFHAICVALGTEELLGQLTEECGERSRVQLPSAWMKPWCISPRNVLTWPCVSTLLPP